MDKTAEAIFFLRTVGVELVAWSTVGFRLLHAGSTRKHKATVICKFET